ncbi:MAG: TatD family deoxyribonuclease [Dehalococcoidia bacterium]|nr:TatD family deoxyribonuclease [Dehalococcoidia bacterium]
MALFLDIHTHIDQHEPGELSGIVERSRSAGVGAIITAGVTVASSERCVKIAHEHPSVFAGVGVHPEDMTGELTPGDVGNLSRLAADPRVVVMSETGLDHTPPESFRPAPGSDWKPSTGPEWHEIQERAFRAQIAIGREQGLAVVFHNRLATEDTLHILKEERIRDTGGAAHYFQGDWDYARALLDLGLYISVAKPLLHSRDFQETVRNVPLEWIVLETDAFPQSYKPDRAKWTEPKDIRLIAVKLAELHGITVEDVRESTTRNALRLLGQRGEPVRAVLAGSGGTK